MALIRKQSAPVAATPTTLYTATNPTVVSSITVSNRSATVDTFKVSIRALGAVLADEHVTLPDIAIAGNDMYAFTGGLTLLATDIVEVTSTNGTCTFQLFGQEI
jgi:hypothetical protein